MPHWLYAYYLSLHLLGILQYIKDFPTNIPIITIFINMLFISIFSEITDNNDILLLYIMYIHVFTVYQLYE